MLDFLPPWLRAGLTGLAILGYGIADTLVPAHGTVVKTVAVALGTLLGADVIHAVHTTSAAAKDSDK